MPHAANKISTTRPTKKKLDGVPSKTMLIILPEARPAINKILAIVAGFQYAGLIIPINQNAAIAIYKPIKALKMPESPLCSNVK